MSHMLIAIRAIFFLAVASIIYADIVKAGGIEDLKSGVVKITSKTFNGNRKIGTGIIVRLEQDEAYILTVVHVVEGDPQPEVSFFTKPNQSFNSKTIGMEGGVTRGLAVLLVTGALPPNLKALTLDQEARPGGGEIVNIIGFSRISGTPWMVTTATVGGQSGSMITFAGTADEGNSGGPLILAGKVIGVINETKGQVGYAVPIMTAQFALQSWGVNPQPSALIPMDSTTQKKAKEASVSGWKASLPKEVEQREGGPMVLVPEGEFWMGSTMDELKRVKEDCPKGTQSLPYGTSKDQCWKELLTETPRHKVFLDSFYIDKYEITHSQYQRYREVTGAPEPTGWQGMPAKNFNGHRSIIGLNWSEADAYCLWAGNRLPSESEWEKAARGTEGFRYPWGNQDPNHELANYLDAELMLQITQALQQKNQQQSQVMLKQLFSKTGSVRDIFQPMTSPVAGASPYGVHDMAGNAAEWVSDWFDEDYYRRSPMRNPTGPSMGTKKVVKGGSWLTQLPFVVMRTSTRYGLPPASGGSMTRQMGVRCAKDAG